MQATKTSEEQLKFSFNALQLPIAWLNTNLM